MSEDYLNQLRVPIEPEKIEDIKSLVDSYGGPENVHKLSELFKKNETIILLTEEVCATGKQTGVYFKHPANVFEDELYPLDGQKILKKYKYSDACARALSEYMQKIGLSLREQSLEIDKPQSGDIIRDSDERIYLDFKDTSIGLVHYKDSDGLFKKLESKLGKLFTEIPLNPES